MSKYVTEAQVDKLVGAVAKKIGQLNNVVLNFQENSNQNTQTGINVVSGRYIKDSKQLELNMSDSSNVYIDLGELAVVETNAQNTVEYTQVEVNESSTPIYLSVEFNGKKYGIPAYELKEVVEAPADPEPVQDPGQNTDPTPDPEPDLSLPVYYVGGNEVYPGEENPLIKAEARVGGFGDPGFVPFYVMRGSNKMGVDTNSVRIEDSKINVWTGTTYDGTNVLFIDTISYPHGSVVRTNVMIEGPHDPIIVPFELTCVDRDA